MTTIQFEAEITSMKSRVDHTYTITLNIPEYHLAEAQRLMGMLGDMIAVAVVKIDETDKSGKSGEYGGRLK